MARATYMKRKMDALNTLLTMFAHNLLRCNCSSLKWDSSHFAVISARTNDETASLAYMSEKFAAELIGALLD